jgi:phosphoenolpyruvate-protein phosphotransferase (PTS system enzyme I)
VNTLSGVAASPGAAVAPAWVHRTGDIPVPAGPVADRDLEVERLRKALESVGADLEHLAAASEGELAEILEAQAQMAVDPELANAAAQAVADRGVPAVRAVIEAGETYAVALEASESEYMAARATDVRDVCMRVARLLAGVAGSDLSVLREPVVIAAGDLAPADMIGLDPAVVRGLATQEGSRTSHASIVARALGIPAVVAVPDLLEALISGVTLGLDGDAGTVFVDPDDATVVALQAHQQARAERQAKLRSAVTGPATTSDGHPIELAANVSGMDELRTALANGAQAVGLLRTELVYLDRAEPPGEDEQAEMFAAMADLLEGGRLVVRTFDFGADKPVPFLESAEGPNPALGIRGIRLARRHPELLRTQLRAVVQAAGDGRRLAVMAPMVATAEEAGWFIEQVVAVGGRDAGVEVGAMVEVPSAVFAATELAGQLDFLSIGTNDLAQYLHAADRQEGSLADLQDPFSPALLRAVGLVGGAAAERDAWVGVCGEAAGNPAWSLIVVGLGVGELSMGAESLLEVRAALSARTLDECRDASRRALSAGTAEEARRIAGELLG